MNVLRRLIPRNSRTGRALGPLWPMLDVLRVQWGSNRTILRFVRRYGFTVRAGPFAGLTYPRSTVLRVPWFVSSLAGTFEVELHPTIEALVRGRPSLFVNLGSAGGYYAVGMGLRLPDARVIAYEADPHRARLCSRVARLNGVKLDLRGLCTPQGLAELDAKGAAVICDVDGAEAELIDPDRVEWLRTATLLVEVHEAHSPGVTEKLRERLSPTHSLEWIEQRPRYLADPEYRMFWSLGLSPIQQQMILSELRPLPTPWLYAKPLQG